MRDDRPQAPVPEAKRPLDASTIQVSNQGVRVMSIEDLGAAFFALNVRMERSKGHGANLFEAVHFNALLLNEMCKELVVLKQAHAATEQQLGQTVLKLTCDTREAAEELHARDAARDATLRDELNGMAAELGKAMGSLQRRAIPSSSSSTLPSPSWAKSQEEECKSRVPHPG